MEPKEVIQKIIDEKGLNPFRMALLCGLGKSSFQDLIEGKKKGISEKMLKSIVTQFPDINPDWIRTGHGPMYMWQVEKMREMPISAIPEMIPDSSRVKDLENEIKTLRSELAKSNDIISLLSNSNRILSETNRSLVQQTIQTTTAPQPYRSMGFASEPGPDIPQAYEPTDVPN